MTFSNLTCLVTVVFDGWLCDKNETSSLLSVFIDVSTVYSKLTAVADDGKLLRSVYKQHLTKSNPFSLPPQLYRKKVISFKFESFFFWEFDFNEKKNKLITKSCFKKFKRKIFTSAKYKRRCTSACFLSFDNRLMNIERLLNTYNKLSTDNMTKKSVDSSSVVRCSIELYKCLEYECSIRRAVNWSTARSKVLSFTFSDKSHANCHDCSDLCAHDCSSIELKRSNTSAQWYSSHLPMFHDFMAQSSVSSWSLSWHDFSFSINCLQSFG